MSLVKSNLKREIKPIEFAIKKISVEGVEVDEKNKIVRIVAGKYSLGLKLLGYLDFLLNKNGFKFISVVK